MSNIHSYQQRYWNELVQLRVHYYYLQEYHLKSDGAETKLNWILAISSNGSIASWAIWQKWPLTWAAIIAFAQLISAIRPYLPYKKRSDSILAANRELQDAMLWAEHKWYSVAEGQLTNEQIHELTLELKKRKAKSTTTHLATTPLPRNQQLLTNAEQQTKTYFYVNYSI